MPLDPQVEAMLQLQAQAGPPSTDVEARRALRRRQGVLDVRDHTIPVEGGSIIARVYTPSLPTPLPAIVYYHGGGFVTGELDTHDFQCRLLAQWSGCVLAHVNYRHAPEFPFPTAAEDAYAGYLWVIEHAGELGIDAARVAVGGDSAGGNLAAVVSILARDRSGPMPVFQWLAYPVTDFAMEMESYTSNANGYGLTRDGMAWFRSHYVPDEKDWRNPLASPLHTTDLSGLPPAYVTTAEFDPLRDEGEAYARRLEEAGNRVELTRYDGMVHGFLGQTADVLRAREAFQDLVAAIKAALARVE